MEATRIGLDLSKRPFEVHGVDGRGEVVLRRTVRRRQIQDTFAGLPRCVIGLESCGTAHEWARQLTDLGHEVRLIAPHAVAPYRASAGRGASLAQVICEALGGETTRFTRVKPSSRLALMRIPGQILSGLRSVARS
jgi:transposase